MPRYTAVAVGEQRHTVGVEIVQRVRGLADRAVHMWKRDGAEEPEPPRVFPDDRCAELVDGAGNLRSLGRLSGRRGRRRDREDRRGDGVPVHEFDRALGVPVRQVAPGSVGDALASHPARIVGRHDVLMDIYAFGTHGRLRRASRTTPRPDDSARRHIDASGAHACDGTLAEPRGSVEEHERAIRPRPSRRHVRRRTHSRSARSTPARSCSTTPSPATRADLRCC